MTKTPDKPTDNNEDLKEQIINEIQPKIQESFSALKNDLIADLQEIKKAVITNHKPQTETQDQTAALPDLGQVEKLLKGVSGDKNLDVSKIMQTVKGMGGMKSNLPMPNDLTKAEWMELRKQDNTQQMIMTIIPLLAGNQGNALPEMFSQMMMRSFAESIVDNTVMRKGMNQYMSKRMGIDLLNDVNAGSLEPMRQAMSRPTTTTPINTPNQGAV